MRKAFAESLAQIADHDPRVMLLTGDLGFMALEPFSLRHPERFVNVGVAEQNMVGIATGLAEAGFIPYVYSIVTFASLRPYEFIRNGPVLHHLPVRIVGVGGGVEYGSAGPTHHGLEDVGVMRLQPGLTVLAPADSAQTRSVLAQTWDLPGPVYLRLGKDDRTIVPGLDGRFSLGQVELLGDGQDLLIVAMGAIAVEAVAAAGVLANRGVNCTVAVASTLNPVDPAALARLVGRYRTVLTAEAHYVTGGVGSLVAEVVAEAGLGCRVVRCGAREAPSGRSGSQQYLEARYGISRDGLVASALEALPAVGLPR